MAEVVVVEKTEKSAIGLSKDGVFSMLIAATVLFGVVGYALFSAYLDLFLSFYTSCVCLAIFFLFKQTTAGVQTCAFVHDAVKELKQVTWPQSNEAVVNAVVVVVSIGFASLLLKFIDASVSSVLRWVLH